jgi:O-succinylbenzoate synthase
MSLSRVELFRYAIRFREPVPLRDATIRHREGALIRLTSNEGAEGWGEAAPLPTFSYEDLDETIAQLREMASSLLNREISKDYCITDINPFLRSVGAAASVRFGLETALLSVFAASRGQRVSGVLTDHPRDTVFVNGLLSGSPEEVLGEARVMREGGYRAVKLKVGSRNVLEEAEVVRDVKEILGDDVSLRLDANRAWGFEEALAFARSVSEVGIAYVEEPLAEPERLGELAEVWGLPVALDESLVGMAPEDLGMRQYAAAVVLKPTLLGGVSRTLRFLVQAEGAGMASVISSSYESGVGVGALVALAALGDEPAGLDTYRRFAEDVISAPLALPAPELSVRAVESAARSVDVDCLEPVPLP